MPVWSLTLSLFSHGREHQPHPLPVPQPTRSLLRPRDEDTGVRSAPGELPQLDNGQHVQGFRRRAGIHGQVSLSRPLSLDQRRIDSLPPFASFSQRSLAAHLFRPTQLHHRQGERRRGDQPTGPQERSVRAGRQAGGPPVELWAVVSLPPHPITCTLADRLLFSALSKLSKVIV